MREPRFLSLLEPDPRRLAQQALAGLMQPAAQVPPTFFYDELGSHLFEAITALPEYYPTRTEAAILADARGPIADAVHARLGPRPPLIDLGAGNGAKAASLFGVLKPSHYVAVDVSAAFLRGSLARLQREHPDVAMTGVGLDFARELALPAGVVEGPALVFYPGSSIGNFAPAQAAALLRQACTLSAGGGLLIGVDLVKPAAVLDAAYDDALGVTAAFNLNLLRHLNHLAGTDFDPRQWRHRAGFDAAAGCVRMHLQARQALTVRWPGGERRFAEGECIHTEDSHKWRVEDFLRLLGDAGFDADTAQVHTDAQGWYAVVLAFAR